jgi:hypothetical protein
MLVVLTLVFSLSSFSQSLDGYNKRFKLKRNDQGELVAVKMNLLQKFSLRPFLKQIKDDIKAEIERMKNKSHQAELENFINELSDDEAIKGQGTNNPVIVRDAINNLVNVDVDNSFSKVESSEVIKSFKFEFKKALRMLDLSIVAEPTDARFFYRKNVTYEVVKRAIEFAKKRFDSIPLLNLASYIIVKVHDLVLEQRTFHQNMLLHYLENFSANELGMSEKEYDHIMSSIYESRIAPINYMESKKAVETWDSYGVNIFFTGIRAANTRLRRASYMFDKLGARINYSFANVKIEGKKAIINTVDSKHMFSSKMPVAYYYEQPNKIKRFRSLLTLAGVGVGFLPIPGWIKANVESFIESFYVKQRLNEGALLGFFESNINSQMAEAIKAQNRNPYILF